MGRESKSIKRTDIFQIAFASVLTEQDKELLIKLYQPLSGYGPISLYFTLWIEGQFDEFRENANSFLLTLLKINISQLNDFLNKLEGLGLLKTYKDKVNDNYIYEIYAPLSAKSFFRHELLGTLFKQKIGDEDYQKIKKSFLFKRISKRNLVDLTTTFGQVYDLDLTDTQSLTEVINESDILKERQTSSIKSNFDINLFLNILSEKQIRKDLITDEFLDLVDAMINLYKLDEDAISEVLSLSISTNRKGEYINLDKFKNKCASYNKIIPLEDDANKKIDDKRIGLDKKIEMLDELDPFEFLRIKKGDKELDLYDRTIIEDLAIVAKLNPGVINVLVDFVMFKQNNTLPRPYIMKIASDLVEKNVYSTKQAMQHFYRVNPYAYKLRGENVKADKEKQVLENIELTKTQEHMALDLEAKAEKLKRLKELRKEKKRSGAN